MDLNINATGVFEKNYEAYLDPNCKVIINQGGSRSSKTYSIIQLLIFIAITKPKTKITIVRKELSTLTTSAMEDWKEIMLELDLYEEKLHNKSENNYRFRNGSVIKFQGLDKEQKARGQKRDILYCNEANELSLQDYVQLKMRTKGKVFIDYNPSELEHFTYDLINDPGTVLIKSTYKDNPYLQQDQIDYIENLIKVDENFYKIYALGERVEPRTLVYNHFVRYDNLPPDNEILDRAYGLDIGFNHPSAFIEVIFATDNRIYVNEIFYGNDVTTEDIVSIIIKSNYDRTKMIYVDSARPDIIESLRRKGVKASLSDKRVKEGIDFIKSHQILININSVNIWRESKMYSWKERNQIITDEIIKLYDDALDAMRYAAFTAGKNVGRSKTPFRAGR